MLNDLMRVEAFTVTIELDDQTELNWQTLTPSGFQPAFRVGLAALRFPQAPSRVCLDLAIRGAGVLADGSDGLSSDP